MSATVAGSATIQTAMIFASGPVDIFNSGNSHAMVFDGPWFGDAPVHLGGSRLELRGDRSEFAGAFRIAGVVNAFDEGSLGPSVADIEVAAGGSLMVGQAITSNSFSVGPSGAASVGASTYTGKVQLLGDARLTGTGVLSSALEVHGNSNSVSSLTLNGTSGPGSVRLSGVRLRGPVEHLGTTTFENLAGTLETAATFAGDIDVRSTLQVNAVMTAPRLTLNGDLLQTAVGGQVSVDELRWLTGNLNAQLAGTSRVRKNGFQNVTLQSFGSFSGELSVERGRMAVGTTSLGGAQASISVAAQNDSEIVLRRFSTIANAIHLLNADGPGNEGALRGDTEGTVSGAVHLGSVGSTLGGQFHISGPISGGDLRFGTNSVITLSNPNNLLSGALMTNGGEIKLAGAGRISAARVSIGASSYLVLENSTASTNVADRIADSTPVDFDGGTLRFRVPSDASASERIGSLNLARGTGSIQFVSSVSGPTQGQINVGTINRQRGTALGINNSDFQLGGRFKVRPETTLPLNDNIVGGWARAGRYFLTQTVNGLVPLSTTYQGPINSAAPASNVELTTSSTLTSDLTINSFGAFNTLNLGGRTLTIDTGGIIGGNNLSNGFVRPGIASEIVLHGGSDLATISASFIDGPSGATDLVIAEENRVALSGNNTYTGRTYVHGELIASSLSALPPMRDVFVHEGRLRFNVDSPMPFELGVLNLSGNSVLEQQNVAVRPTHISVESGDSLAQFTGSAPFLKAGRGIFRLRGDSPSWNGPIEVAGGLLTVVREFSATAPAGSGTITVRPGGKVSVFNVMNPIVLDGGTLAGHNGIGAVTVTSDSRIEAGASGSFTEFRPTLGIDDGRTVVRSGFGTLVFVNDTRISGALIDDLIEFVPPLGGMVLRPATGKRAWGGGTFGGTVEFGSGGVFSPGDSVGTMHARAATVGFNGGIFEFDLSAATGTPGEDWDLLNLDSSLSFLNGNATLLIKPRSIDPTTGVPAALAGFDPTVPHTWQIIGAEFLTGNVSGRIVIDAVSFVTQNPGAAPGTFSAFAVDGRVFVRYIPEPALALPIAMVLGFGRTFVRCGSVRRVA